MDKTLISGLDKGVGGSLRATEFLKIESFFFTKTWKIEFKKKIDYISAAHQANPLRPGIYFWTSFCPKLDKLQF
jgi:hypothetical protein